MGLRDILTDSKHLTCNSLSKSRQILPIMSEFKRVMNSTGCLLLSPAKTLLCIQLIGRSSLTAWVDTCSRILLPLLLSLIFLSLCGSGEISIRNLILLKFSIFPLGNDRKTFIFYLFSYIFICMFYMSVLKSQWLRKTKMFLNNHLKLIYLKRAVAWIDHVYLFRGSNSCNT